MQFSGKKAVITGGASGIGAGICRALVARGAHIVIADWDDEKAGRLAEELGERALSIPCDVRDAAAVEALAEQAWRELDGVDLVFANAGVGLAAPILHSTLEEFEATIGVNLRGVWATSKAFASRMVAQGRKGHICLTGSEHSLGLQHAGNGIYTASKHAVLGFGDVLRAELEGQVGVSVLCPGLVATGISQSHKRFDVRTPSERSQAVAGAVMAKGLSPDIVAEETLAAIAKGDFLIVTHPTARGAAERRWEVIDAAFATQPPQDGSRDHFDVDLVVADVLAEFKGG